MHVEVLRYVVVSPSTCPTGALRFVAFLSNNCRLTRGVRCTISVGIINLLVATAPLLKTLPHAVLLTSLMASLVNLHRYKNTADFQEKLLCMSPDVAGILLGKCS